MNDITEVRQGWEFVRDWVQNQTNDLVASAIIDACQDGHPANDVEGVFICCATTQQDDANQWRLYAHEVRGYSVELDGSVPLTAMARETSARAPFIHRVRRQRRRCSCGWAIRLW